MSIIFGVLREEFERLEQLAKKYRQEIQALPKGSIQKKRRNGHCYVYLSYRKQNKVISKYIGKDCSPEAEALVQKVHLRKTYQKKLKQVTNDLKEIQKVLHARSRKTVHRSFNNSK